MIPYEIAIDLIQASVLPIAGVESLNPTDVHQRVASQPVLATRPNPAFDNSAVDGYLLGAPGAPEGAEFEVVGEIRAGSSPPYDHPLEGQAVRIFTGAPAPWPSMSIVMQEDVNRSGGRIRIKEEARSGPHFRKAGSDFAQETLLVPGGARFGPAEIAMASWCGLEKVEVFAKPTVAVFVTGDELIPPGTPAGEGQIYDSNGPMLSALAQSVTPSETVAGQIGDTLDATKASLLRAARESDLILVSGGASVGDYDHVPSAVAEIGEVLFHGVSIKPGKPVLFGRIGDAWIFGLPGNPASAFVCFEIFVRHALRILSGEQAAKALTVPGKLSTSYQTGNREEFVRVRLSKEGNELSAEPVYEQGSFGLRSLAAADGLARLQASRSYQRGEDVSIMILPHHL